MPASPFRTAAATLLAMAVLSGAFAWAAPITGPSKGNAAAAKRTFQSKCVPCHKADGTGGVKLTGNPTPNWHDAKRMSDSTHTDDYLRDCLTNGRAKSGMPAWGKSGQLKPEEIENLIAYIRTFSAKKK